MEDFRTLDRLEVVRRLNAIVAELEEGGDGPDVARAIAGELIEDLALARQGLVRCDECSFSGWPGQLDAHRLAAHSWRWAA